MRPKSRETCSQEATIGRRIQVSGYGCRLPGAPSPEAAWQVLHEGRSTVAEVPASRWSDALFVDPNPHAGRSYTRRAGVLEAPFDFDAAAFGLSRSEALQMDPQQRLLLETVADSFRASGIDPGALNPVRTGVYVGAAAADHASAMAAQPDLIGPHFMLGNTLSILSNRISHQWDFQGPSMTVDTACSSALFALDLARSAIAEGRIDTAVVGAVNLLLSPMPFVGFSQANMLSQQGRVAAFDASADGYVRAEGTVVFILQAEDVARDLGLPPRSWLVGSGVNTDGRTSTLSLPSADRQAALIEDVVSRFDLEPEHLAYLEAHGTGTPAGDPREAAALGRVYGAQRRQPLPIGSAKTNFGHLEAAAGLVGLLKAQLVLEHGLIPPTLHVTHPNPEIDWAALNLSLAQAHSALNGPCEDWLVGVNSFGFGGANAHAVLRGAERPPAPATEPQMPDALMVTAASAEALRDQVAAFRHVDHLPARVASANHRTARLGHRLCLPAGRAEALTTAMDRWLSEGNGGGVTARRVLPENARKLGFVFSGNGSAWVGMGRHIYAQDPAFRGRFREVSDAFRALGCDALDQQIFDPDLGDRLGEAQVAQPLVFAVQLAMVAALRKRGVVPAMVLGHSVGELAAAVTADRLSLDDAARIIDHRSQCFAPLKGQGSMAALACSADRARALIDAAGLPLDIAAENAPESVTIAGTVRDLETVLRLARKARVAGRKLAIDYAYHSRQVTALEQPLLKGLEDIAPRAGQGGFVSGWGGCIEDGPLDARYWLRNAHQPVAFRQGVQSMAAAGIGAFVEIGPRPVLQSYLRDSLAPLEGVQEALPSLSDSHPDRAVADELARDLLALGTEMEERPVLGCRAGLLHPAPAYVFNRETLELSDRPGGPIFAGGPEHPVLGKRRVPETWHWQGGVSLGRLPWLRDHRVAGQTVAPATLVLDLFRAAALEIKDGAPFELVDLSFLAPLTLDGGGRVDLNTIYEPAARQLTLFETDLSRPIATARLQGAGQGIEARKQPAMPERGPATQYARFDRIGLAYGPAFARLETTERTGSETRLTLAPAKGPLSDCAAFTCAADALLQGAGEFIEDADVPFLPVQIGRVRFGSGADICCGVLALNARSDQRLKLQATGFDADGRAVVQLDDLTLQRRPVPKVQVGAYEEVMVPFNPADPLDMSALAHRVQAQASATSETVALVRSALAGRIAWDMHHGALSGTEDQKGLAQGWLQKSELLDAAGQAKTPCPWPELDAIMDATASDMTAAMPELWHALGQCAGNDAPRPKPARLSPAASQLLVGLDGHQVNRLCLAGSVDAGLLANACQGASYVAVLAQDAAQERQLESLRQGGQAGSFAILQAGAGARPSFDVLVIVGAGGADALAPIDVQARDLLFVDETPDLFAAMTGGITSERMLRDRLEAAAGRAAKIDRLGELSDGVVIHHHRPAKPELSSETQPIAAEIEGTGPLAETLRGVIQSGADAVVLQVMADGASLPDLLPQIMQASRAGRTQWLISPEPARMIELSGWRRVIVNETDCDLRLLVHAPEAPADALLAVLHGAEPECLVSAKGDMSVPRVQSRQPRGLPDQALKLTPARGTGSQAAVAATYLARTPPAPHEVELAIEATGLNFRDVMLSTGALPADAFEGGFAGPQLGLECAGRVLRAGADSGFAPGDRVAAVAGGTFASHVTVVAGQVLRLPDEISFAEAATLPVAYTTADYALTDCARLSPGDSVLIHGGAGGVGLAAIQIARSMGLQIYATAGDARKRRALAAMGLAGVYDSRSLSFADEIISATDGRGVDAVINSLAGEFLDRSLSCLAPFGHFIELGKRDVFTGSALGLRALRDNITFSVVDVDSMVTTRPDRAKRLFGRLEARLAAGAVQPLPRFDYAFADAPKALQDMQRGAAMGKLVLTDPPAPASGAEAEDKAKMTPGIRGSWLVTGGTGGFGLQSAKWLAEQGAEALWLVSRSGVLDPDEIACFASQGVLVEVVAADVADAAAMQALCDRIGRSAPPLRGVLHAANQYHDASLAELSPDALATALETKLGGAQVLDRVTRVPELDHFWLYASIAGSLGNPHQAGYVAANRGLEALAEARHREGLPALAIGWGAISDTGILTRDQRLAETMSAQGVVAMTATEALDALAQALPDTRDCARLILAPRGWAQVAGQVPVLSGPVFEMLRRSRVQTTGARPDLARMLAELGRDGARGEVLSLLRQDVAALLHLHDREIDPDRPLAELGFDSLLAMQLRVGTEETHGITLPIRALDAGANLKRLADAVLDSVSHSNDGDGLVGRLESRHIDGRPLPDETRDTIRRVAAMRDG